MLMCVAVACKTEADANLSLSQLSSWLQKRGLKFSAEKTRIINVEHGFDFLGFNVRLYNALKNLPVGRSYAEGSFALPKNKNKSRICA
jgi:hypothetical protein